MANSINRAAKRAAQMTAPHEALVEEVAELMHRMWVHSDMAVARAAVALIAERTKQATEEMIDLAGDNKLRRLGYLNIWSAMHAASPLWPKEEGK